MAELVDKWKLGAALPVDAGALNGFRNLREKMYKAVSDLGNYALLQDEFQEINKILRSISIKIQINSANGGLTIIHQHDGKGWALAVWRVAESFADMVCHYDKTRIKICDNDDCGWVFYDESKNKSRRWCDDKACGNIMKVRRFRSRQKESEEDCHEKYDQGNSEEKPH